MPDFIGYVYNRVDQHDERDEPIMREPDLAALHPKETLEALHDFRFPPYITLAHIFHAPPNWSFANRTLKQYALNYVIDGQGEFTAEGSVYQVGKGDVFFYRPYETHGLR